MSNAVFPVLPGLGWSAIKSPMWSTLLHKTTSGREYRSSYYTYPLYKFTLTYEILRAGGGFTELQQLLGFFNARQGAFDTFLYQDPDDNTVTTQAFGAGDGVTKSFQLVRSYGGYVEPVFDTNGAPSIYDNAVLKTVTTDYTINATGLVTFVAAPVAGHTLTWTGNYYRRVRFVNDQYDFDQFMKNLWALKKLEFVTVKP